MYHVDCKIDEPGTDSWRATCFYGEAKTHIRHQTWDTMKGIASLSELPWVCFGDFNEVLRPKEQEGIGERGNAQIQGFREAVDVCMLLDIGYSGRFWTFEKKVRGGSYTKVRLDRALANADWRARFPLADLTHLTAASSDHSHILMRLNREQPSSRQPKPFRYEVMWEGHESWSETINSAWTCGGSTTKWRSCELNCKQYLMIWGAGTTRPSGTFGKRLKG